MKSATRTPGSLYQFRGHPPLVQLVPAALQHVAVCVVSIITPAIMIAQRCGLSEADTSLLVQNAFLMTGLATLLQVFSLGRVGARLPIIVGASFAYIPILLDVGGQFGISAIFGAQLCGGVVALAAGFFYKYIRHLFPPLVSGTVIFTVGLSLYTTGIRYMAGGDSLVTNALFGSWKNWLVAGVTLVIVTFFSYFTKGILKLSSIMLGIVGGCLLAWPLGLFQVGDASAVGWFQLPQPLHFGLSFHPSAILSLSVMFLINAVQGIGDLSSVSMNALDREPDGRELSGGIMANGVAGIAGALLGAPPCGTYSQNVGVITSSKVVNRLVFALAAAVFVAAGLVPKFSFLLTSIPTCVIGGATISVFSSIAMGGIRMIATQPLNLRNTSVVGIAVALGLGLTTVADSLTGFPAWVNTIFGASPVVMAAITATLLNLILPQSKEPEPGIKAP